MFGDDDVLDATDDRLPAFLDELTKLSHRHGIAIGGCGCCESPFVAEYDARDAFYRMNPDGRGQLEWVDPASICSKCKKATPNPSQNLVDGLCSFCRWNAERQRPSE